MSLFGTATPGSTVALYKYIRRGKWAPLATARVPRSGAFSFTTRVTGAGIHIYEAVAKVGKVSNFSRVRTAAFAWFSLKDVGTVDSSGVFSSDLRINGRFYPNSYYGWWSPAFAEWNVDRSCSTFRAVVGMRDDSRTGATGQIQVLRDDEVAHEEQVRLGSAALRQFDISGALRVRFNSASESRQHMTALGAPQVLCWKKPGA